MTEYIFITWCQVAKFCPVGQISLLKAVKMWKTKQLLYQALKYSSAPHMLSFLRAVPVYSTQEEDEE